MCDQVTECISIVYLSLHIPFSFTYEQSSDDKEKVRNVYEDKGLIHPNKVLSVMVLCNPKQQSISLKGNSCSTSKKNPFISTILRPLLFLIYFNDLSEIFTDDTSTFTTNSIIVDFQSNIKAVFE
jgi:hypothetical protein